MCAQLDFLLYPEFTRQNRIFIHVYVAKINKKSNILLYKNFSRGKVGEHWSEIVTLTGICLQYIQLLNIRIHVAF